MTVTANAGEDVDEGEQWECTLAAVGASMEASQKPSTISHVSWYPCQYITETLEHICLLGLLFTIVTCGSSLGAQLQRDG